MKKLKILFTVLTLTLSFGASALFGIGDDKSKNKSNDLQEKTADECEIPAFAKAIGHEDLWLKHNGCPPREEVDKSKAEEAKK